MVFAAPLFLMSSTSGLRGVYLANKQAFINVGFGMSIGYLAVGLMSKMVRCGVGWGAVWRCAVRRCVALCGAALCGAVAERRGACKAR